MTYEEAKEKAAALDKEVSVAGAAHRAHPRTGLMGLPVEEVRLSPEFRKTLGALKSAQNAVRAHNSFMLARFRIEILDERAARRAPKG